MEADGLVLWMLESYLSSLVVSPSLLRIIESQPVLPGALKQWKTLLYLKPLVTWEISPLFSNKPLWNELPQAAFPLRVDKVVLWQCPS